MEISVALRGGDNLTDMRSLAIAEGISYLPHTVKLISRAKAAKSSADLVIQTGFGRSVALLSAIEQKIPYLIMEAPMFRDLYDVNKASNFTYNGLQNGGTRPEAPMEARPHPDLLPMHTAGPTLILAQKPTDHSLRGSDHIGWLKAQLDAYPEAEFRHHPIMVPKRHHKPIADALANVRRTVAFTSTASVDSVFAGCETICDHPANEAYEIGDREEWAHRLSWYQFTHEELKTDDIAAWILTGYDRAYSAARTGDQEIPRERVNGSAICGRYYRTFE